MISRDNFYKKGVYRDTASNLTLVKDSKMVWKLNPSSNISVTLPTATLLEKGGMHFILINNTEALTNVIDMGAFEYQTASADIAIKDKGGNTIKTLSNKECVLVLLLDNSTTNGTWIFINRTIS